MCKKLVPFLFLVLWVFPALADNHVPSVLDSSPAISLGEETYRGVVASAQIKRLADGGQYLLSVIFASEKSGGAVSDGDVAVKITSPGGTIGSPIRLNLVDGIFQAEIQLSGRGESMLKVGSKLTDDKKRIYRFFYAPG